MRICLVGMTALVVLRELRRRGWVPGEQRVGPFDAEAYPRKHWSKRALLAYLERVLGSDVCSHLKVLQTCVVSASARLRCEGVSCSVMSNEQASRGFVDVGQGLRIASPELLFVQMGNDMPEPILMMLGSELTGRFSRDASDPAHGGATFDLRPVTSEHDIAALMRRRGYVRSRKSVQFALEHLPANSWSPMESVLGTMMSLPREAGGYELAPVTLNREVRVRGPRSGKRRPDILIGESGAGINYEGSSHFGIEELGKAVDAVVKNPGPQSLSLLRAAANDMRRRIVEDKRRDRELIESDMSVVTMTSEDLASLATLDREVYEVYRMAMRRLGQQAVPMTEFLGTPEERAQRQKVLVMLTRPLRMAS